MALQVQTQAPPEESTKRFVLNAILLSLIEPVRGEPTVHSLDRHPHDDASPTTKFLDSFALICSTGQGKETASAVCMEQGGPTGTILRLARNSHTSEELLGQLQEILDDLTLIASGEVPLNDTAYSIMCKIVTLDRIKIDSIVEQFQRPKVQESMKAALRNLETGDFSNNGDFLDWVNNLPSLMSLSPGSEPCVLIDHMKWAAQARWVFSIYLQELVFPDGQGPPGWVNNIYKLGRYYAALLAMIKLATTQRESFPVRVEVIETPSQIRFSLNGDQTPLRDTIQRVTKVDHDHIISELSQYWLTKDPEVYFRKGCKGRILTVHAEMQLLCFYDHHPELTPRLLFMGTSKKACFLCHKFLSRHELGMSVSATHSKLYPTWMPPLFSKGSVRKVHTRLIWGINQHLEQTIGRDLETRLKISRTKKIVFDSTAGPSLTSFNLGGEFTVIGARPVAQGSENGGNLEEVEETDSSP